MRRAIPWLAATVALAAALLGCWWWFQQGPGRWRPALSSRELALRVLGRHLAGRFPGAKALIVGNPFTLRDDQSREIYAFEKASVRGFQDGFGAAGVVQVVHPALRSEAVRGPGSAWVDPKTTTPLSYLVAEDSFDRLAGAHPGVEVMVSLIGLPAHIRQAAVWRAGQKPRFALLLPDWRLLGDTEAVREAFKSGKVAAAILRRPGGPPEDEPLAHDDEQGEFERRFILANQENIDELLQRFPHSF